MKLLKGKRLGPILAIDVHPRPPGGIALVFGPGQHGLGRWDKGWGNVTPLWSVIVPGGMPSVPTEDRAPARMLGKGLQRPVLKHGPRSLTSMRVFGLQTLTRNESERRWEPRKGRTIDRS